MKCEMQPEQISGMTVVQMCSVLVWLSIHGESELHWCVRRSMIIKQILIMQLILL